MGVDVVMIENILRRTLRERFESLARQGEFAPDALREVLLLRKIASRPCQLVGQFLDAVQPLERLLDVNHGRHAADCKPIGETSMRRFALVSRMAVTMGGEGIGGLTLRSPHRDG